MNRFPLTLAVLALLFTGHALAYTNPIYVSPTGNDTTGNGTSANPYKTPDRARQAVAALPACSTRTSPIQVYFASGFYPLSSTWTFSATDSGCAASPVTYTMQPGAATTPIISGGVALTSANGFTWTNVSGSLWRVSVSSLFSSGYSPEEIYYNGTRRFRPRAGATGNPPVGLYYRVAATIYSATMTTSCPLLVTGLGYECFDRFKYTAGDPPDNRSTWTNYAPWSQNSNCTSSGNANYDGDIEILVFEYWTMARERVACVDTTNKIVYLAATTPTNSNHGYITGHRYMIENVSTGTASLLPGQFFIDRNGVTGCTAQCLFYMAQTGENPSTDSVVVPVRQASGTAGALLSATSLQYVTFSDLQFSHDNYIPPTAGFGAVQSNTNLPAAMTCLNCSNVTFTGNYVTQTIGNALWFETNSSGTATPTANSITYNNFYDLGSDGIVYGSLPAAGDTGTNILNSGTINENLVQGYGRMYAGASGIEHPFGAGTSIQNNDVTDGYNSGIGVCIPNGNINCGGTGITSGTAVADNISGDFNHVWNIGKGVTDDMGAFYIATYVGTGNEVKNNRLHDVQDDQVYDTDGYGGNGVYIDNGTGLIDVENNLVYRVSQQTFQNTQGPSGSSQYNTIHNNIFAYGRVAMFYEGGTQVQPYLTEIISNNIFYFDRTSTANCGIGVNTTKCTFSVQAGCTVLDSAPLVAQTWNPNLYWNTSTAFGGTSYAKAFYTDDPPVSGNGCPKHAFYTFTGWQGLGQEAGGAVFNPNFINPTCTFSTAVACWSHHTQDNFQITGLVAGQTLTITTGNVFTAFSMSAPGRQSPTFTPSAIQDTFPTLTFDTTTTSLNF